MAHRTRRDLWIRRKRRVRVTVVGTAARPRLCVTRTARHMYAQLIDDSVGRTLVAASTRSPDLRGTVARAGNVAAASRVGALLARRAREQGITRVVFDRSGHLYHGRVKAVAAAAREGGLEL